MGREFFSAADARTKLHGSIVMFKEYPYYCTHYDNNTYVLTNLDDHTKTQMVDYRDKDFDYLNIKLGYIQNGGNTIYLTRQPLRQVRQALSYEALRHCGLSNNNFASTNMLHCILGRHSNFSAAYDDVMNYIRNGAAFDRHFAIKRTGDLGIVLEHRGSIIATMTFRDQFAMLRSGAASHLLPKLTKLGVPVC